MPWYGYSLLAAVALATVGLLEKKTLRRQPSREYVAVFSTIKLFLFLLFFARATPWAISPSQAAWLVVDGVIGAAAFYMVAKAIRRMELSSAVPVLALDPGLTAMLAFIFLGERLRGGQVFGLAALVFGAYLLEVHRRPGRSGRSWLAPLVDLWRQPGGWQILAGMAMFALTSTIDRYLLVRVPTLTYIGYTLIVITAVYLLGLLVRRRSTPLVRLGATGAVGLIGLAAALHLLAAISEARAISLAAVGLAVAIKRTSILIDVILGGRLLHEKNITQKVLASVIMLVGVYFVVR